MKNFAYKLEDNNYSMFLDYQIRFPSSRKEQIHSAYHKKRNVWNKAIRSNTVSFRIK